jgi:hypothetical protein
VCICVCVFSNFDHLWCCMCVFLFCPNLSIGNHPFSIVLDYHNYIPPAFSYFVLKIEYTDHLLNEHIKAMCSLLLPEITQFFNNCLVSGIFPSKWKLSDLRILFKGKGSVSDVNSYRGICLSSNLYNLLDRILYSRMYSKLIEEIPFNQFGFVKGRSTVQAVKKLISYVNDKVYNQDRKPYAVFLDV